MTATIAAAAAATIKCNNEEDQFGSCLWRIYI